MIDLPPGILDWHGALVQELDDFLVARMQAATESGYPRDAVILATVAASLVLTRELLKEACGTEESINVLRGIADRMERRGNADVQCD